MDLNELKIINPWWEDRSAIESDVHLLKVLGKEYYYDSPQKIEITFDRGNTYIIRGPRQVGKTTLIKELIKISIVESFEPEDILFLSCEAINDHPILTSILTDWLKNRKDKPTRIFLDEITFVKEWQRSLLWLLNSGLLKNSTTIITGSNARDLKVMGERFPGRNVREINIYPLSIAEYKSLNCFKMKRNDELLDIYFQIGGFPHAIRDYCLYQGVSDNTCETYANWIFGDAHRFQLSREFLEHILFRIYDTLASQVTFQRLTEKSPIKSYETASSYVEHLELAFLCKMLNCYDPENDMSAHRKARKIYFIDPLLYQIAGGFLHGVRNTHVWWKAQLEDRSFKGKIFESIVVNNIARKEERIFYWYSSNLKREADLLLRKGGETEVYDIKMSHEHVKPILGKEVKVITPENLFGYIS